MARRDICNSIVIINIIKAATHGKRLTDGQRKTIASLRSHRGLSEGAFPILETLAEIAERDKQPLAQIAYAPGDRPELAVDLIRELANKPSLAAVERLMHLGPIHRDTFLQVQASVSLLSSGCQEEFTHAICELIAGRWKAACQSRSDDDHDYRTVRQATLFLTALHKYISDTDQKALATLCRTVLDARCFKWLLRQRASLFRYQESSRKRRIQIDYAIWGALTFMLRSIPQDGANANTLST